MPKTRPPYPAEFRQQIIELANAGRTPAELSREFGVSAQSIANWIGTAGRDAKAGKPAQGALSNAAVIGPGAPHRPNVWAWPALP